MDRGMVNVVESEEMVRGSMGKEIIIKTLPNGFFLIICLDKKSKEDILRGAPFF